MDEIDATERRSPVISSKIIKKKLAIRRYPLVVSHLAEMRCADLL